MVRSRPSLLARLACSLACAVTLVRATTFQGAIPTPTPTLATLAFEIPAAHQHTLAARQQQQSSSATSSSVSIPQTAAAGGLTYLTPAQNAGPTYYKIASGNPLTFGWNYTSLYVTPTSLTFEARCSANGYTYPVGVVPGAQTSLTWDPWAYAQSPNAVPFAQASYTLRVYDSRGPDATAEPGLFNGANSILTFAMYSPAAYTPLASGWTCVGCSAAVRAFGGVASGVWVAVPVTVALVLIGGAGVLGR
ncbi:hypothetical protein BMF94_2827 [Rhodotorula taiwanensis]|uniref:DUF7137 domain-containing protein n=1 Tax=Rhodotorula taiwanensis TaxID=741276 RepID=A0A2S5BB63_9BASI|nr:hypothetical protein BMF94_2827 [Rhodotorula taiwanensis]